jgi:hypothetical protein
MRSQQQQCVQLRSALRAGVPDIQWIQRVRFSIFVTQVRSVLSCSQSVNGSSNPTGLLGIDAKSRHIFIRLLSILVICRFYSCHIPTLFLSYADSVLVICRLHSCHIPTLFLSYADSILVICRLCSCHIPTLFLLYADSILVVCLVIYQFYYMSFLFICRLNSSHMLTLSSLHLKKAEQRLRHELS